MVWGLCAALVWLGSAWVWAWVQVERYRSDSDLGVRVNAQAAAIRELERHVDELLKLKPVPAEIAVLKQQLAEQAEVTRRLALKNGL